MALIQKAFSDIITFSRSSNATRVGPTGVLEYAPHNLVLQSQTIDNASWTKTNASVTANAAAAPNGTITADLLYPSTSGTYRAIVQGPSGVSGAVYTASFYVKASGFRWVVVGTVAGANVGAYFDLQNGLVGIVAAGVTASITSVGNGWYRCSATSTSASATIYSVLTVVDADGSITATASGTNGVYVWGAQLSVGPYALDYTPTTSAAVYGPRFDYDGSGVTIVEPVSTNLVIYSEDFSNAAWLTDNGLTVSTNAATAPDGTTTADQLNIASDALSRIQQVTSTSAGNYTLSVWLRVPSGTASIRFGESGDLETITVTTTWQRFTRTVNTASPIFTIRANASGTVATVYAWGAQLEVGSTATAYMVSGATNGFRAVPVVSGSATPKGLLIEEQRTNLIGYSEQFDDAAWTKSSATITANSATAPDGQVSADTLTQTSVGGNMYQGQTVSTSTTYTASIFLKAGTKTTARFWYTTGGFGVYVSVEIDLSAGTVGSVVAGGGATAAAASIQAFGNGWYRVSLTGNIGATTTGYVVVGNDSTATGSIYAWGAQLEAGAFSTSYLPTVASSVTRSADVASVNTLSPWYNASAGTVYAELERYALINSSDFANAWALSDGTTSERFQVYNTGAGQVIDAVVSDGGIAQAFLSAPGSITANTTIKTAFSYAVNDFALVRNAGTVQTDTSGTLPTVDRLRIGADAAGALPWSGYIRRIAYYPRRLTNAELQALTA